MIMAASSVSLKTMKNIGTENKLRAIFEKYRQGAARQF